MEDILLGLIMIITFALGYFLMKKLDDFLEENRNSIEKENEKKEPSCIILTDDLSKDEIMSEIQQFQEKHEKMKIIICDDVDTIERKC